MLLKATSKHKRQDLCLKALFPTLGINTLYSVNHSCFKKTIFSKLKALMSQDRLKNICKNLYLAYVIRDFIITMAGEYFCDIMLSKINIGILISVSSIC